MQSLPPGMSDTYKINTLSPRDASKNIIITRSTQKRLICDLRDLMRNPLADQGIYYSHDDNNMLKGYAVIIGPSDTPYMDGFYLFEVEIPYNYPFAPPKLKFMTQGDSVRFNPNLYRNGKVCLSILNTWKGEQWTSCQTLRTVLLTLTTILNKKPILNEPGITEKHRDFKSYHEIIEFKNYEIAINGMVNQTKLPHAFFSARIDKKIDEHAKGEITRGAYLFGMSKIKINYSNLKKDLQATMSALNEYTDPQNISV
jgi:ubiquitin-protein ligase